MGGSQRAMLIESLVSRAFLVVAVMGFKTNFGLLLSLWRHTGFLTFFIIRSSRPRVFPCGGPVSAWRST
jgi:hypothetical protein